MAGADLRAALSPFLDSDILDRLDGVLLLAAEEQGRRSGSPTAVAAGMEVPGTPSTVYLVEGLLGSDRWIALEPDNLHGFSYSTNRGVYFMTLEGAETFCLLVNSQIRDGVTALKGVRIVRRVPRRREAQHGTAELVGT